MKVLQVQIGLRDNAGGTDSKVIQIRNNAQNLFNWNTNDSYQSFSEKVRITGIGSVGIGIDTPVTKLDVVGDITIRNGSEHVIRTTTDGKLQFLRNAVFYNQVTVTIDDANGNIGIGTDNPGTPLHVFGSSDVTSLIDAAAGDALLNIRNAGDGNWSGINFKREKKHRT